jgi:uncharacterized protein (DUF885 family)
VLERPLFYEGWACVAESIAARRGYPGRPSDRFVLSARRLRRALRGKADLELQCGRLDPEQAAGLLVRAGYAPAQARGLIGKYALRPGYQLCYSLGLREFGRLLDRAGPEGEVGLARQILRQGEMGFRDLERAVFPQPGG